MKKLFLSTLIALIFAGCASTGPVTSNYKQKEYTKKGKAVIVGGVVSNLSCKESYKGAMVQQVGLLGNMFKSKDSIDKSLKEKEYGIAHGESRLLFVKAQNVDKEKEYSDYEIISAQDNKVEDINIRMVEPGEYVLRSYNFMGTGMSVDEEGHQTGEYVRKKSFDVNHSTIKLAPGDVIYIGNFEINEKDEKNTIKLIDQSQQIREYFKKEHPELAENMKINFVKIERVN
jgi:hypothetical protein